MAAGSFWLSCLIIMFPYFELLLGCIKKSCRTINNSYRIWLVVGTFKREMNVHFTKFKVGKVFQDLSWANVFSGPCLKCTCMYTWCSLLFSLLFKLILRAQSWRLTGRICDWIFGCAPKNSCVIAPVRRKTQSTVRLTYFRLYLRTRTRKTVYV